MSQSQDTIPELIVDDDGVSNATSLLPRTVLPTVTVS